MGAGHSLGIAASPDERGEGAARRPSRYAGTQAGASSGNKVGGERYNERKIDEKKKS